MHPTRWFALTALLLFASQVVAVRAADKTLVVVAAHPDDEGPVGPILARYAREGVQVYLIIATDGAQGAAHTSIPSGPELARTRAAEARCATDELGINPPIFLGFPDAQLGNYMDDRGRLFELSAKIQAELQRLRPGALITWGPDGGTGHPDHRLVSGIVTQLVRAGAPGAPESLFYAVIPGDAFRAIDAAREQPPFLIPLPKYFVTRVHFGPPDLEASLRAMACHKTQYPASALLRLSQAMRAASTGELRLAPLLPTAAADDLFAK